MEHSEYMKVALKAVNEAEKIIMKYYGSAKPDFKDDKTPVTIADRESENIIVKTIKEHFPDHGFLGEEFGAENTESEFTWIIDPIDGTPVLHN